MLCMISSLVIDIHTSPSGLKNDGGHTQSRSVVSSGLFWNPTTYKFMPYYTFR